MLRSLFVRLCLPLVAALALLGPATAAHAARGMEVALSDEDAMVDGSIGDPTLAYQTAQALNATRMRVLVQWSRVSDADRSTPSANPDYDWGPLDNAIDLAALYGMRTQLALAGPAPAYASGDGRVSAVRPDPSRYADFVKDVAQHFKGRVDRYSIWNEPNYPSWLSPQKQSPQIYRALYIAGYNAIKSVDPNAQVLIGETVPYGGKPPGARKRLGLAMPPLQWLRAVACVNARYKRIGKCTPLKADGYAHHPYEFTTSPLARKFPGADNAPIQTLGRLRTALTKLARAHALSTPGGRPLDIYLTESGYFASGKRKVPRARAAVWLPQQFQVAARQPRVREMLQYNIFIPHGTTFTTGLFTQGLAPLPDFHTFLGWTQKAAASGLIKRNSGPVLIPARPITLPGGTTVPSGGTIGGGGSSGGGGSTGGGSTDTGGTGGTGGTPPSGGTSGGDTGSGDPNNPNPSPQPQPQPQPEPPPPNCIQIGPVCVPVP